MNTLVIEVACPSTGETDSFGVTVFPDTAANIQIQKVVDAEYPGWTWRILEDEE